MPTAFSWSGERAGLVLGSSVLSLAREDGSVADAAREAESIGVTTGAEGRQRKLLMRVISQRVNESQAGLS